MRAIKVSQLDSNMENVKKPRKLLKREILQQAFNDWLSETSLHGMKYFVDSHVIAKIIWVSVVFYFSWQGVDLQSIFRDQLLLPVSHMLV